MIYEETFKIGIKDIGKENKITNKAILKFLENIASYHSDSVGYGINESDTTHITWLLLDWKLKVINRPNYGQILTIRTWSRYTNKCYSYRDFEVLDENDELCAFATSKWVLIDTQKGRISKVQDEMIEKYKPEAGRSVFNIIELEKVNVPENYESSITYQAKRRDMDVIGHMHNLYYLDLAYEALPNEVYENLQFNNIRISYKKEIKLDDIVKCNYVYEDNKHVVVIKNEDESVVHATVEMYE